MFLDMKKTYGRRLLLYGRGKEGLSETGGLSVGCRAAGAGKTPDQFYGTGLKPMKGQEAILCGHMPCSLL